jgi:hypothetical protein
MLYLNFEGCKDNKMMDLINEGKKKLGATNKVKSKKI